MKRLALVATIAVLASTGARADYIDHFAAPDDSGIFKVPHEGRPRVLVIPVVVDDLPFEQGSEQAFLDELHAFFDPDADGWAFTPYWDKVSLGRFHPEATVASPVRFATCPKLGAYEDCEIPRGAGFSEGDTAGAIRVLDDSLTFMDEILRCASAGPSPEVSCTEGGGVHFPDFDTSGPDPDAPDGVVDGVIIISNAGFPGIALPIKELSTLGLLQFLGPFPDFTYDGAVVGAVAISGRASLPQRSAWVSVHEFGHLLGFADLYDESGQTTDMPYTLMGGWYYADPASLLDGYSRMAIGWAHIIQATSGRYEIGPADVTGTVLRVGTGDEFFTVELRRKRDDSDGDLGADFGVVVERVRLQKRPSPDTGAFLNTLATCVNCTPFDTFLSIEQADGELDLERGLGREDDRDLFLAGDAIAPSENTEPRSFTNTVFSTNRLDGAPTGVTIRVVEASADKAVIEVETPDVADTCAEIAPWCRDEPCKDGSCGEVVIPDEVKPPDDPGCTCAGATMAPSAALLSLLAVAGRGRRRR